MKLEAQANKDVFPCQRAGFFVTGAVQDFLVNRRKHPAHSHYSSKTKA